MLKAVAFDLGGTLFSKSDSLEKAVRAQWKAMKDLGYGIDWDQFVEISKETEKEFNEKYGRTVKKHELGRFLELFFDRTEMEPSEEEMKKTPKGCGTTTSNRTIELKNWSS